MTEPREIIVADDDQDLVKTLRDFLEFQGFRTYPVYEGIRAIEMAHKKHPDLIILDLKMPAGSGDTVLQNLRSHPATERIPVMILTGMTEPHIEREVRAAGAQEFVTKPYNSHALLEKIRTLLPAEV